MNRKDLFKSPAFVTMVAGLLVAGVSVASFRSDAPSLSRGPAPYTPPSVAVAAERLETLTDLKALDRSFTQLARYAAPAVVSIRTEGRPTSSLFGERGVMTGEGSGVVFRPDGWIITNDHVVGGYDKVTVVLHDGREFPGQVTRAQESDIAVVKIEARDLPTLKFADSNRVEPGQLSMAVGAPFGLENSVTIGHISAKGRTNQIPDTRNGFIRRYFDLIQTDTPINVGNSGGPLINVDGEVIGINTAIFSTTGGSNGIGFAISSNQARFLAETLIEKGSVTRSYMGVAPETIKPFEQKERGITGGAILRTVESDGPAASAGLRQGDVVVQIGSLSITNEADLRNAMFRYAPGTKIKVDVVRDRQRITREVTLAKAPTDGSRPFQMPQVEPPLRTQPQPFSSPAPSTPSVPGRVRMGVQVQSVTKELRDQFKIPANQEGAVVMSVEPGSVAETAGIEVGDLVQGIGDRTIRTSEDLVQAVSTLKSGDSRSVRYSRFRDNVFQKVEITVTFR